jgi:membrane protease YdiL (CAAX protease family)
MFLAGALVFNIDLSTVRDSLLIDTGEKNIGFLKYLMISQDISLFIVPSVIILNLLKPYNQKGLMIFETPRINEVIMVILLVFCIFPLNSFIGLLNSRMIFPDWLSGIEQWMVDKENRADNLISMLITSESFSVMITNIFVLAVIPSIGEELLFRGVFQKILYGFSKSGHPAIWLTAFIFSSMHLQFFGFIPRLILGLIFGYLFFWSRTLWLPVIAHFINNVVPVIVTYLQDKGKLTALNDSILWKHKILLIIPVIIIVLILLYFRNKSRNNQKEIKE